MDNLTPRKTCFWDEQPLLRLRLRLHPIVRKDNAWKMGLSPNIPTSHKAHNCAVKKIRTGKSRAPPLLDRNRMVRAMPAPDSREMARYDTASMSAEHVLTRERSNRNHERSPLLCLPLKLRNRMYELCSSHCTSTSSTSHGNTASDRRTRYGLKR